MNNKEIYTLLMELGSELADLNFTWSNELRAKFEKVTAYLELKDKPIRHNKFPKD